MRAHSRPSQIFQRIKIGMAEMMRVTTRAEKRTLTTVSKSIYDPLRIGRKLLRGPSTIMAAAHHITLRIAFGRSGIICSEAGYTV
jgi:hypothetical protein